MSERPRILVLEGAGRIAELLHPCLVGNEVVRVDNVVAALGLLREQRFDAFCADPSEPLLREQAGDLTRAGRLLDALADGVAVVDAGLRVFWANPAFAACCDAPAPWPRVLRALGTPEILGPDYSPFHTALAGTHRHHPPALPRQSLPGAARHPHGRPGGEVNATHRLAAT